MSTVLKETLTDEELDIISSKLRNQNILKLDGLEKAEYFIGNYAEDINTLLLEQRNRETKDSNGKVTCFIRKRRSFGDIYLLMKGYYPDITVKEVREALFELLNNKKISTLYCKDISKRVFYHEKFYMEIPNHIRSIEYIDEYGFPLMRLPDFY